MGETGLRAPWGPHMVWQIWALTLSHSPGEEREDTIPSHLLELGLGLV